MLEAARAEADALRAKQTEWRAVAEAAEVERNELHRIMDDKDVVMAGTLVERIIDVITDRDAARGEVVALRSTLRAVLDILKSGRSTGRTAIKALFAAEDVIEGALATAE